MRKSELQSHDPADAEVILNQGEVGYLGIMDPDGYPRAVPVNFVFTDGRIYFHGATEGEKHALFQAGPKVTFSAAAPHAVIPSHWMGTESACTATAFFKSACVRGRGSIVKDLQEKAAALQALMEKYQPEGGYKPITASDPLYDSSLRHTAIFRIDPQQMTVKIKLGRQLSEKTRRDLIQRLEARNQALDRATAAAIRKTLSP